MPQDPTALTWAASPEELTERAARTSARAADASRAGLDGRYEDLGLIAVGGMGEVRRVHDRRLDVTVAMKILAPALVSVTGARARFVNEGTITAQLQHPGIVAVLDRGELTDGRLWYTMTEVQGQTLAVVQAEATLRQRVDRLLQVARAVAHAHSRGVVHRDLKPENIMVGAFGEVRVMDWGIARIRGRPADGDGPLSEGGDDGHTRVGSRIGTPGWMAPEQAEGRDAVGPPADVHALGSLLWWSITGQPPGAGSPPPGTSTELLELVRRARAAAPADRPTAMDVVAALEGWLDGARRRTEALRLVAEADVLSPTIERLLSEADALADDAARQLANVLDHEPIEAKRPAWALQDRADALRLEAATRQADRLGALQGALVQVPELAEAHERLADHYAEAVRRAEREGRPEAAAAHEARLRDHDRGRYGDFLAGAGQLTLHTDPPGAEVVLHRYVPEDRWLVLEEVGVLGTTPLDGVALRKGSYRCRIAHPERPPVDWPVVVERGEHVRSIAPGEGEPHALVLPERVPKGTVYVPAGWFEPGGDPDAVDPVRLGRVWVDGFFLTRDPVTLGEYGAWLASLDDPDAALPQPLTGPPPLVRTDSGVVLGEGMTADLPVTCVTWLQIQGYVSWRAARDGIPWRLPHGIEWEKACRGADARRFPTGNHLEPTRTVISSSRPGSARLVEVGELDDDRSPHDVRGLAGNAADVCANAWTHAGGEVQEGRLQPATSIGDDDLPEVRGGHFSTGGARCRAASRLAFRPAEPLRNLGFRLAVSLGAAG